MTVEFGDDLIKEAYDVFTEEGDCTAGCIGIGEVLCNHFYDMLLEQYEQQIEEFKENYVVTKIRDCIKEDVKKQAVFSKTESGEKGAKICDRNNTTYTVYINQILDILGYNHPHNANFVFEFGL